MENSHGATIAHNTALIVEGGAMRSVFSAGLLDRFLQEHFNPFDFYIGVSAGASNLAAFLSGEARKSLDVYLHFALHDEFISYGRFFRGGHLLDLDWIFSAALSQSFLNIPAIFRLDRPFYVGLTDVVSGGATYVRANPANLANIIKASTALPVVYRGFPEVDGRAMTDGGVADGIPVQQAIRLGAKRIMVIRSRTANYRKKDSWGHRYIRWKLKKHASLVAVMRERVKRHEDVVELICHPPSGVSIIDVYPPEHFVLGRFSRDRDNLLRGYEIGFAVAADAIARWRALDGVPAGEVG